jgi:hypothetical protein
MTRRKINGYFPILVKLFGSQEAGEIWIKGNMKKGSKVYSVYKAKRKIDGSIRDLLLVEIARRSGFVLEDSEFKWRD